jgi:chemotaxis protein methyltransferase CheR
MSIPAKAGIQRIRELDSRLRGNDGLKVIFVPKDRIIRNEGYVAAHLFMTKARWTSETEKLMSDKEFRQLSNFILSECGIKMPPSKKILLQTRLQKRLNHLGMNSFKEYCDYLFSPAGKEKEPTHLFDSITTNKTDFFREAAHFDYLVNKSLPDILSRSVNRRITTWSAGCSSGEEPYTIAIVMKEFAANYPFDFLIIATDISTEVLELAMRGIYREERIEPMPLELRKKYLLKSKDTSKRLVKIAPEIMQHVKFRRLNFMEGDFGFREPMDIIFCRNVFIYFERDMQEKLVIRFSRHLLQGGYLFIGHSESLYGMDIPFQQVAPAVYRRL